MKGKRVPGRFTPALIIIFFCASLVAHASPVHGAVDLRKRSTVREPAANVEMVKILPVLEGKIGDRQLLEKSKEKIYAMDDREVRLIAALCEKISTERQGLSSDIAFLLVTALIVLS